MLMKCSNPLCYAAFRSLEEGRLFRLESDSLRPSERRSPEYFWLCHHCSATMTLQLDEADGVRIIPRRDSAPAGTDNAGFVLVDRRRGFLLNRVSFPRYRARRRPSFR